MSLLSYYKAASDSFPKGMYFNFDYYDGVLDIITINEDNAGYYNNEELDGIDSVTYLINDVEYSLPFTLVSGDVFQVEIVRTVLEDKVGLFLSNYLNPLTNFCLNFVLEGAAVDYPKAKYDSDIYLYQYGFASPTTFNSVSVNNVSSYKLEIDTGSGFVEETAPFTINENDYIRLTFNRVAPLEYANIRFNSTTNNILNIHKSIHGYIPYCTQKFNGTSQYCTIPFDASLQMSSMAEDALSGWVYPTANTTQCFLTNVQSEDSQGWYIKLKAGSTSPTVQFQLFDDAGNSIDFNTTTEIPLNKWTFYSINKLANDDVSIYLGDLDTGILLEEVLVDNSVGILTGTTEQTTDSIIGKDTTPTRYFSGHFDNLVKINRNFTYKEIEVLFNHGWSAYPMTILKSEIDFYYKISRVGNAYYQDFGEIGNNATLVNFAGNLYRYFRETMLPRDTIGA